MKQSTVFLPDEDAIAEQPRDLTVRAMRGCAIVWFLPYRRDGGVIEIPQKHREQSVEAIILDDNTGYGLPTGTKVLVSRMKGDGIYFEVAGVRLCRVKRDGLYLIDERDAA